MSEQATKNPIDRARKLGPWATALDTGPDARLSTFWQRRMAMLSMLNGNPRVSWPLRVIVAAGALAVLALPLVYLSRENSVQADDVKQAKEPSASAGSDDNEPDVEFLPPLSKSEERILEALGKPVSLTLIETPLQDVVNQLKKLADEKIEIQLDSKALEEAGVGDDTAVTFNVSDVKLASALRLMLERMDLRYTVRDDVVLITTSDAANIMMLTRAYPVADLVSGNDYHILIEAITTSVQKDNWEEVGGPGTITSIPAAKCLIISCNREVHDEVLELLRSLRAARKLSAAKTQ